MNFVSNQILTLKETFIQIGFLFQPKVVRTWNKVFEIGDPKTGTSSLGKAFEILNLRHKGWDYRVWKLWVSGKKKSLLRIAKKYDAFEDGPWHESEFYKELDLTFPNSKFILLEREEVEWIKSHEKWFSSDINIHHSPDSVLIKGYTEKRDEILQSHRLKYERIKEHFAERPDDLLVMNICAGEGWEKLCPFLGLEIPKKRFPYSNIS